MSLIRLIAAAATAMAVALALSPASARSCEDDNAACATNAQSSPMKLDQFMNTWKPVTISKHPGKSRSARRRAAREAVAESKSKAAAKHEQAEAKAEPAVTEPAPPAATLSAAAIPPAQTAETDGVAVTSFNQPNELDAAADQHPPQVQVVAFNEINELDLAAPPPPLPTETVGQSVAAEPTGADNSWIGKLLLAAAGTIALAGATRFLVA
jgi:hypothetical protein